MTRNRKVQLPLQGDAFAVPLEDGRYSVCRILLDASSDAAQRWGADCVLVACSAWIGAEIPRADDAALRPILCLTHHSWAGKPEIVWISDPLPDGFIPIGQIPPTTDELSTECGTFGGWSSMTMQPLMQWRWDNDRAAVLAEDKVENAKAIDEGRKVEAARAAWLSRITLQDLVNHEFFPRWEDYPPPKAIRESRGIMAATVQGLIELGESASKEDRMAILQSCIDSFNELDAKLSFIETVEREDICEEFEMIVHACGLGRYENLADQWRNW